MIGFVSLMIGIDRVTKIHSTHHVRNGMPNKNQLKNSRANTTRVSAHDKKIRRQQVFMAVVGIVLILAMVMALIVNT
jgi:hypothetical protein